LDVEEIPPDEGIQQDDGSSSSEASKHHKDWFFNIESFNIDLYANIISYAVHVSYWAK
jgi:hypothetical protein